MKSSILLILLSFCLNQTSFADPANPTTDALTMPATDTAPSAGSAADTASDTVKKPPVKKITKKKKKKDLKKKKKVVKKKKPHPKTAVAIPSPSPFPEAFGAEPAMTPIDPALSGAEPAVEHNDNPSLSADDNTIKVFGGVDFGHTALAKVPTGEQNKSGYLFDVKGSASFYTAHWDIDAGIGYFSSNISTSVKNIRVVTNGFLIAVDPQYRILPQWQLGIVLDALIGSDVSFSESASSTSLNLLAGLGTKYDFKIFGIYDMRLVAQGLTTVTNLDRMVWAVQGGVQFGFKVADN